MTEQSGFFSKFRRGDYSSAADVLKEKSEKEGKDQILYLLDRGIALYEAKDYKESIKTLTEAERLSAVKDFTSINEEVVSVITTDKYKKFVPLDYERIMINVYLALSYFMLGQYEDALVECRRINNLVYVLKNRGMKDFEEVPLARYVSGMIYETQGKYDSARIDYLKVVELNPLFTQAIYDAYRCARLGNNVYIASTISNKYPNLKLKESFEKRCKSCGELVVLLSYGEIPVKRQSRSNNMLPEFYTRTYSSAKLDLYSEQGKKISSGEDLLDLETVARKNLNERIGRIMAKRLLGVGAQVAIGYGVAKATDNDALGVLAGLLLHSTSSPDTRSWSTLPRYYYVARTSLEPGLQKVKISTDIEMEKTFEINNGKLVLDPIRIN
ncbi:MAG TPA: hypothetical protein PK443_00455 [bacterium]|nr:hypothetical protein [bacterium]